MSKAQKIDTLLLKCEIKSSVIRKNLGAISPQSWSNKRKRDTFTADDLIIIARTTGTVLAFVNPLTKHPVMTLDSTDLRPINRKLLFSSKES